MSVAIGRRRRLSREFAAGFLLVSFLLTSVQIALDYRDAADRLRDQVSLRAGAVTDGFSLIAEANPSFSLRQAEQWMDRNAHTFPDLLGLYIVDPQGRRLAGTERSPDDGALLNEPRIRAALSLSFDDQSVHGFDVGLDRKQRWIRIAPLTRLGSVMVAVIDLDSVRREMSHTLIMSGLRRFAALIVLLGTIYALVRGGVVRPITRLADAIRRSNSEGHFEPPSDMPPNEIGALADIFSDTWSRFTDSLRANRMLALVANGTQAGVLIADATGRIVWSNAGFVALTGFERSEIEGHTAEEILASYARPIGAVKALCESWRRAEPFNIEMHNQTKAGHAYWASIEARPIWGDDREIEHFIVVETDITHVKDTKYALRRSEIELAARVTELQETQLELERERAKLAQTAAALAQARRDTERRPPAGISSVHDTTAKAEQAEGQRGETGLNVLLAEDQAVNQKLVGAVIERLGHRLTIANNGAEAVRALHAGRFDLVLMDIQMPEVDGILATKIIRSVDEPWRTIPIIALTAHSTERHRQSYLAAGMDGFVAKPFKIDILVGEMARVLTTKTATAESGTEATDRGENEPSHAALLENVLDDLADLID
ncbi:response regulator [Parvibaculum sp.]|uniref:response regulator n=1 Tax=Parvibaculum sp. TaxID=2024848 RepID=UPI00320C44A1